MSDSGTPPSRREGLIVDELLVKIRHSHRMYYQMINIEIWALIETLDQFFPGSWGRFMVNRQVSLKQFLERQKKAPIVTTKNTEASKISPDLSASLSKESSPDELNN
jgi:hypothetical protein